MAFTGTTAGKGGAATDWLEPMREIKPREAAMKAGIEGVTDARTWTCRGVGVAVLAPRAVAQRGSCAGDGRGRSPRSQTDYSASRRGSGAATCGAACFCRDDACDCCSRGGQASGPLGAARREGLGAALAWRWWSAGR